MRYLEDFISPTREELATWDKAQARRIDEVNREIFKRNRLVVNYVKRILSEAASEVPGVRDLAPPAVQIEYARKYREMEERDREAEAASRERWEMMREKEGSRSGGSGGTGRRPIRR